MAVLWACTLIAIITLEKVPIAESNDPNTQILEEEILEFAIDSLRFWQFEFIIFITNRLEENKIEQSL